MRDHEAIVHQIIGGFYEVYNRLGYGFREYIYSLALERELTRRGLRVAREVWFPIYYCGEFLANERADLLVEDCVVVENKARRDVRDEDTMQLKSYLRSSRLDSGLLLHYGIKPRFFRLFRATMGGEGDDEPAVAPRGPRA